MQRSVDDVFVTGGEPTVTYVSRDELGLERTVRRYLRAGNKVLAVSGPSKSGKTVLIRRVLAETATPFIALSGAGLDTVDTFWHRVAHKARLQSGFETTVELGEQTGGQMAARLGGGALVPGDVSTQVNSSISSKESAKSTTSVSLSESVREFLCGSSGACLVIDDFHYAPPDVRRSLAREIKDLIFAGARVVVIAVPTRILELLSSEGELTGRLTMLRVDEWREMELLRIATKGYDALNLDDPRGVVAGELVRQSYGSPSLMQELCREVCEFNNIEYSHEGSRLEISAPLWVVFFDSLAANFRPSLIDALLSGPMERRRRKLHSTTDPDEFLDIYAGVLVALSRLLPKRVLSLTEISDETASFMTGRPPMQRVRSTCRRMGQIADQHKGDGDPALDFIETAPERVCIEDPYLAFYLRWGLQQLGLPVFPAS